MAVIVTLRQKKNKCLTKRRNDEAMSYLTLAFREGGPIKLAFKSHTKEDEASVKLFNKISIIKNAAAADSHCNKVGH